MGKQKDKGIKEASFINTGGWLVLVWPSPVLDDPRHIRTTWATTGLQDSVIPNTRQKKKIY